MIQNFLKERNQPDYRLGQFNHHFYQELVESFDEITTWSKDLRQELKDDILFSTLKKETEQVSKSGDVVKTLFSLKRNSRWQIEAVLMRYKDGRNSVCVSCMSGCPVGCSFCATGQMGLQTNLTSREIVDQVLYFARMVKKDDQKISNVVYMGMGEPMLNLEGVEGSLDVLMAEKKMGMSKRRITVSTVGYVNQFKKFIVEDGYRPQIAISLHAPTQKLRAKLMPVANVFPLDQLFEAIDQYVELTNKQVTYEYILIDGVNDQPKQAHQLADLLEDRLAHVNLIPYNPVPHSSYERSKQQTVKHFSKILNESRVSNTVRVTMGDEIDAACGQLSVGG